MLNPLVTTAVREVLHGDLKVCPLDSNETFRLGIVEARFACEQHPVIRMFALSVPGLQLRLCISVHTGVCNANALSSMMKGPG